MKTRMYFKTWQALEKYVSENNITEWESGHDGKRFYLQYEEGVNND